MADQESAEGTDYGRFLRPEWVDDTDISAVWIAAYEILLVTEDDIRRASSSVEALGARISFGFGSLDYFDTSGLQVRLERGKPPVFLNDPENAETPAGPHVVIAFPMPGGADNPDEEEATRQEHAVIGLLVSFVGRNAASRKLFDMTLDVKTGSFGSLGTVDYPFRHGKPNLKDEALLEIEAASKNLDDLSASIQQRVRLALRWFGDSLAEDVDEDAFVKLWVALEVLGMPNQINVRPLNEMLADAYNISYDQATQHFRVGQIQGLRSDMLHEGITTHHFPLINTYTQALFIDLLRHVLGVSHIGSAQRILDKEGDGIWLRLQELRQSAAK